MKRNKRLFLFAAYDQNGIIDDALIYYVSTLSKFGDIIVCLDSDCQESETKKLKHYTIHTISGRHKEYDFGSYKRAFQYAKDKKILKNYETMYLVNDSVFGPLFDVKNTLLKLESLPSDAAGMVESKHKTHSFMESWFIRLNASVFLSSWFDDFISSVIKEANKYEITIKYEHGLSNLIKNNNLSWSCLYKIYGRETYNRPKTLFIMGCPFIKKASFIRHNGAAGAQIKYTLRHADKSAAAAVLKTANRVYGEKYMNWLLTSNPFKIMSRNIKYAITKLKNGTL